MFYFFHINILYIHEDQSIIALIKIENNKSKFAEIANSKKLGGKFMQ